MKLFPLLLLGGVGALAFFLPKRAKAESGPLDEDVPDADEDVEEGADVDADDDAAEEQAAKDAPVWEGAPGGPPTAEQVSQTYATAMAPGFTDLGQLGYAYSLVNLYGTPEQAGAISAKMASIKAGTYMPGPSVAPPTTATPVPMPTPSAPSDDSVIVKPPGKPPVVVVDEEPPPLPAEPPGGPPGAPPPLASEETTPDLDPNGTVTLARLLLEAEGKNKWKSAFQPQVKAWQARVGLTSDGKFGVGSSMKMADEVGVLPLVRYWSGWDKGAEVQKHTDNLRAKGAELKMNPDKRVHGIALQASANREKGQGWPAPSKTIAVPQQDLDAVRDQIKATLDAEEGDTP